MPLVNIPQGKFLAMPHKFRLFVAGFGAGKTYVGCIAQCIHYLEHPGVNQGYFAPTYSHIRDIFYPTIDEVAANFGFTIKIKTGDKEVAFYRNGKYHGTTICRSLDNPAMIIGFKIGRALLDEFDVLTLDKAMLSWRKVIARMRWEGASNGIDVATTPEGFRASYKIFQEDVIKKPELASSYGMVKASTYENEINLPGDYIQSMLDAYPSELIDAYINGEFTNLTSGTVLNRYRRKDHKSVETIREKEPLIIGMDFNITNMSAAILVKRKNEYHAVGEITGAYDTPSMITIIKDKYPEHHIKVYPDASGNQRRTASHGNTDISLLEGAGFSVYAQSRNPAVKDRIQAANVLFSKQRLFINDILCPELSKCAEQLAYDKNGAPDKKSNLDHMVDAFTYPIDTLEPIVKPAHTLKLNYAR